MKLSKNYAIFWEDDLVLKFQDDPRGWPVKIGISEDFYPQLYPFSRF